MQVVATEVDDATLVVRARMGDAPAFEALVRRYAGPLLGHARSLLGDAQEAEDAAQDALLKAWGELGRHDLTRSFGAWVHRILHNRCVDVLRARKAWAPIDEVEPAATEAAPLADGQAPGLAAAIASLPPRQRAVLELRFALGLDGPEIAARLDMTPGNVRVVLHRAITALRERLVP